MATIKLSKSGNVYQLAVNGWSKKDTLNLTVIATNEPDSAAVEAFTGNEEVEMRDASIHITAQGYVYCRALERVSDYPVGGMDTHGDDILADVWKISLADTEQTEEEQTEEKQTEEEQTEEELPFTDEPYAEEQTEEEIPAEG